MYDYDWLRAPSSHHQFESGSQWRKQIFVRKIVRVQIMVHLNSKTWMIFKSDDCLRIERVLIFDFGRNVATAGRSN